MVYTLLVSPTDLEKLLNQASISNKLRLDKENSWPQ